MTFVKPLLACAALCAAATTHATPPSYDGVLHTGSFAGTVEAESGPWGTPELWSLWTFTVPWGADVRITVTPTSADFDPYIAVFYGTESDLSNYVDMSTGSLNTVLVAHADGVTPFGPNGIGDPARVGFHNLFGDETFVLAIADYTDGSGSGALSYGITAQVPEPSALALLAAGLGVLGLLARRRT